MDPLVTLGVIVGLPLVLLSLFRANAAIAFLALCLGSLLGTYVVADAVDLLRGYVAPNSQTTEAVVALVLLWLPVIAVLFFMMGTISAKQRVLNLLPALAVGLVGALLTVPFLTPEAQVTVMLSDAWIWLESYQALIVATGTIISLMLLRMRKPALEGRKGKH